MPARDGGDAPRSEAERAAKFRRPDEEAIRRAARRAVRGGRESFPSQVAFRAAVLELVRRDEPLAALGGRRLRRLMVGVPGLRLSVRYAERAGGRTPTECPVCGGTLVPIRNRTLTGGSIELGRRCTRCDYWTHGHRRVPVRYAFSRAPVGKSSPRA